MRRCYSGILADATKVVASMSRENHDFLLDTACGGVEKEITN